MEEKRKEENQAAESRENEIRTEVNQAQESKAEEDQTEETEENQAEGGQAEGGQAEGGQAEGGQAEGGQAEGSEAEGGQAEGDQAEDSEAEDKKESSVFRQKALDRISSPEQLTDYLRVSNPQIWAVLLAVIILLAGLVVWSTVGRLESTLSVKAVVHEGAAQVIITGSGTQEIKEGMELRIGSDSFLISSVGSDEYGRTEAAAQVPLPDGSYDAVVVTESIAPIQFLLSP